MQQLLERLSLLEPLADVCLICSRQNLSGVYCRSLLPPLGLPIILSVQIQSKNDERESNVFIYTVYRLAMVSRWLILFSLSVLLPSKYTCSI